VIVGIDAAVSGLETPGLRRGLTNQATMIFPSSLAFPAAAHFLFLTQQLSKQDRYQWTYWAGFELVSLASFFGSIYTTRP
jgi:hypothetical protein